MYKESHLPKLIFQSEKPSKVDVSILIPTYQRTFLLERALTSAINQDANIEYEIIVVDNDQSEKTHNLICKLSARYPEKKIALYQHPENIGLYGNWNSCLQLGSGEWLTILSDDDLLEHSWLNEMWNAKLNLFNPMVLSCELNFSDKKYTRFRYLRGSYRFLLKKAFLNYSIQKLTLLDYFIGMPHQGCLGILFDRMSAIKCGGFNIDYHPCADYELFSKLALQNRSYIIRKQLATYVTSVNISETPKIVRLGLDMNQKVQRNLVSYFPKKYSRILLWYTEIFSVRSISGSRTIFQLDDEIQRYFSHRRIDYKFNTVCYFLLKGILTVVSLLNPKKD